jgi:hypothetical protein
MSPQKVLVCIIGSVLFFPVSFGAGIFAGTRIIAALDSRDPAKGEQLHPDFTVLVETNGAMEPVRLDRLPKAGSGPTGSFLLSDPSGELRSGSSHYSYAVLGSSGDEQLIEVIETRGDGDRTVWSTYRAKRETVEPAGSRMFYFGYLFMALPYAFIFSLSLYGIGVFMRKRREWDERPVSG